MELIEPGAAHLEQILDDTYPLWGEGLTRQAYGVWNRTQMATRWGSGHLRRVALVEGDALLASAKRYDLTLDAGAERLPTLGIGAVFTPESRRGRGHARALIELMIDDAVRRGCRLALLFSEIGSRYYESMGFRPVPRRLLTIEVIEKPGAPATFVRSGEAADLPAVAAISQRYATGAALVVDRTTEFLEFVIARRRLLAGLGPAGLRHVEFFVAEEGHRAVAYVLITRGPRGVVLESCGDHDPSGARVGSMLQVLASRAPAEARAPMQAWLPASFRPPQVRVRDEHDAPELMMITPIGGAALPDLAGQIVYWPSDVF